MDRRVLYVDLIDEEVEIREVDSSFSGLPLALSLYRENTSSVVFAVSSSAFASIENCSSVSVAFTSPVDNSVFYSSFAGEFGDKLSALNIDAIVVAGTARKLSYLYLSEDACEIRQCEAIRFSSFKEFSALAATSSSDAVLAIGRAGERGCYNASLFYSYGLEVARGGIGAVLGQHNLKGIVASASPIVKTKDKYLDALIKKSKIVKRTRKSGPAGVVALAHEYGWMPIFYYQGKRDMRMMHLERTYPATAVSFSGLIRKGEDGMILPGFIDILSLGPNAGFFSADKIVALRNACFEEGLSPVEVGDLIGYLRFKSSGPCSLKGKEFNTILHLIYLMGEKKGIGEDLSKGIKCFPDAYKSYQLPYIFDVRGSLSSALFAAHRESILAFADLILGFSRRFDERCMGMISAYLRVYSHALMTLGPSPFMLSLMLEKRMRLCLNRPSCVRRAMSSLSLLGYSNEDLLKIGLASMDEYDSLVGRSAVLDSHFRQESGESGYTESIRYALLDDAYESEIRIIRARAENKK